MADSTLLNKVKEGIGVTGTALDSKIQLHIDDIVDYLIEAGVTEDIAKTAYGVIARGVNDILFDGGVLSKYFYQRAAQLVYKSKYGEV